MMDDEIYGGAGGSVISFGKVPCTPVTGTYGAFYDDVFGDVERISSSGSSDDQSERRFKLKSINKTNNRSNYSAVESRRDVYTDPYISFLQDKQHEILGALHEEIRLLKHENADLKFQIHVILHHSGPALENPKDCTFRNKLTLSSPDCYKDKNRGIERARNRTLELELESATKMIEELKWVQQHYETKIRVQEVKIEDLERQLNLGNTENIKVLPIQVTPMYQTSKLMNSPNQYVKPSRQRSSSVTPQRELTNRRNSLQSMLPDDYKQAVATLPPILTNADAATVALRNTMSTAPSALGAPRKPTDNSPPKPRKSSLMHSNPSLARNRNNIQSIFGDPLPPQHNGDAQYYFSK